MVRINEFYEKLMTSLHSLDNGETERDKWVR